MDGWRLFDKNCCVHVTHLILAVCEFLLHLSSLYLLKNDVNCIKIWTCSSCNFTHSCRWTVYVACCRRCRPARYAWTSEAAWRRCLNSWPPPCPASIAPAFRQCLPSGAARAGVAASRSVSHYGRRVATRFIDVSEEPTLFSFYISLLCNDYVMSEVHKCLVSRR